LEINKICGNLLIMEEEFKTRLVINTIGQCIELCIDPDEACYHEWIQGEGADISIWRAFSDNRVVGVTLPLKNWDGKSTIHVDII